MRYQACVATLALTSFVGFALAVEPPAEPPTDAGVALDSAKWADDASAAEGTAVPAARLERYDGGQPKPPPLHVDYLSYGIAMAADILADPGAICRVSANPCILGSGGGVALHGGYHSPGPWYVGGAYQFSTTDSSNLYRLGVLQQLRAEMGYRFELGLRAAPFATWGIGGVVYGNEWGVETGGGTVFAGLGAQFQISRLAVVGVAINYQPVVFAAFVDTADFERDAGLAQYVRFELKLEIRSELSRH